jgi:hypothetical protein
LLVVALAAALVATRCGSTPDVEPAGTAPAGTTGSGGGAGAPVEGLPAGTVAMRSRADQPGGEGLADSPTACLLVVDHATREPVAGAAVRRLQGGGDLAFTDDRGLAALPLRAPEQLAVVSPGCLLRLVPARLGSTEQEPQVALLVRDQWSPRRTFRFVGPDTAAVAEAFVRFAPVGNSGAPVVLPADELLRRAWTEHTMLAGRPACADVAVQLGSYEPGRVHRLADGDEVRFAEFGEFTLEAATTSGLVARTILRVDAPAALPLVVAFTRGVSVSGTVVGAGSAPLAGAELSVQGGDPLGLVATTDSDGVFRLGPLAPGPLTLHVFHGDHESQAVGPLTAPAEGVRIGMRPLPATTLRGRVRSRPGLEPLGGATVVWSPVAGSLVTATTGPDGSFALRATGEVAAKLVVNAPGHRPYAELVAPDAPFLDYDLWPGTTEMRLDRKMTALLEGVVLDARGMPAGGVVVKCARRRAARSAARDNDARRRVLRAGDGAPRRR